jgi:succinyl-CoA synthetase alpha subunit
MVLMQVSSKLLEMEGVARVAIMMATDNNKPFIAYSGFSDPAIDQATASDLVIALETNDDATMADATSRIDLLLKERGRKRKRGCRFITLEGAMDGFADATLAVVSVPGQYAGREARKALERGLHVLLFSDNVPLQEEVELKRVATQKGLLLMGPDCGTAILNGAGLGFANAVRRGPIGIVGASGTGIQELCVILERAGGLGISHAIGTGGRDLSDAVGGATSLCALDFLADDPETESVLFISKPPSNDVAGRVLEKITATGKPSVVCFLGLAKESFVSRHDGILIAENIEEAALAMIRLRGGSVDPRFNAIEGQISEIAACERVRLGEQQTFLRGLFSGGSFCYESMVFLRRLLPCLHANSPVAGVARLENAFAAVENTVVDLGEDEFTRGRVHPMIDPTPVAERIRKEAKDENVGVILFDVVLGYGAHPDPASVLVPAIRSAREDAMRKGRHLVFVSHVCGTDNDPQGADKQERALKEAETHVLATNLQATRLALEILRR